MKVTIKIDDLRSISASVNNKEDLSDVENGTYKINKEDTEVYLLGYIGGFENKPALTEYSDNLAFVMGYIDGCNKFTEREVSK